MNDQTPTNFFEIRTVNGTPIVADDLDELINWVKIEREFWEWLASQTNKR